MNKATMLVSLCGLLISMCVQAEGAQVTRPRWAIVLTIADATTGARIEQTELDPKLEFDDPIECQAVVAEVGPLPGNVHYTAALTCREVRRGLHVSERAVHGDPEALAGQARRLAPARTKLGQAEAADA